MVDIPERGLDAVRTADAEECAAIARALDVVSVDRLEATYRIETTRRGRYLLTGELRAELTQTCVVTLEPISSHLREPFEAEFWPADQIEAAETEAPEEEVDPTERDVEPIEDSRLAVGRIVAETLATAVDPYPRKPGATFDWEDAKAAAAEAAANPFAVLARLRTDKGPDEPKG